MSEITHLASAAADLLIADCHLPPFRHDEAARIIQDALDLAATNKAKETIHPSSPAPVADNGGPS